MTDTEFALNEWQAKTDWVQKTAKVKELGMHRADMLRIRIEELESELLKQKQKTETAQMEVIQIQRRLEITQGQSKFLADQLYNLQKERHESRTVI